jgi:hypothetical protein
MNRLVDEQVVVRPHTDAGKEFWSKGVSDLRSTSVCILPTKTAGYDPDVIGRVEQCVGTIKQHDTVDLTLWVLPPKAIPRNQEPKGQPTVFSNMGPFACPRNVDQNKVWTI